MASRLLNRFVAIGTPFEVLVGGDSSRMLSNPSGLAADMTQLPPGEQRVPEPLNLHWFGYEREAAKKYWSWLNALGRQVGENFLAMDLLFSFVYGGALAASLAWVWMAVGRPFHPAWIMAPLAMMLTAEWTEHCIQRVQLRPYVSSNDGPLPTLWIQISSCATMIKLWLTCGLYVSLAGLVVKLIVSLLERYLFVDAAE
jgi:hypothetical protein